MTTPQKPLAAVQPPATEVGVIGWLRHNLFSSWGSSIATIVLGTIVASLPSSSPAGPSTTPAGRSSRPTCACSWWVSIHRTRSGAWLSHPSILSLLLGLSAGTWSSGAIRTMAIMLAASQATLALLVYISGLGPVATALLLANAALIMLVMPVARRWPPPRQWLVVGWLASLVLMGVLLYGLGDATPLAPVSTSVLGRPAAHPPPGGGRASPFRSPSASLLALGRRSGLPVVRVLSTAYIELIRAVPLITILFMADLLLPLFLPGDVRIDRVLRAMGGITIFSAAYVAENVRGGLQAIPTGQIEAAQSVGLRGYQVNLYIVLPQALRISIPANVGLFISLLKDTTLVIIIGLLEILGIGQFLLAKPEWIGTSFEVFIFVGAVFFVLSYALSRASYRLEEELGVGQRE